MDTEQKMHSLYELLQKQFGVELAVEENPSTASIGTTDVVIAPNNPRRLGLVIINLSTNTLYLRPGAPASATAGILVTGSGGSFALNWQGDFHLPSLEWHAVASGAASAVYVVGVLIR